MEVLLLRVNQVQIGPFIRSPLKQNVCIHVQSHTRVKFHCPTQEITVSRLLSCHLTCHDNNNSSSPAVQQPF